MYVVSLASLFGVFTLVSAQTGQLGDARPVTNNPVVGEAWKATFNTTVTGTVTATAAAVGVNYTIDVKGLPVDKGPYKYHVHVNPVPSDGNCTATGGHLDPFQREDVPACNATAPATCEIGDLSGKYGTVPGPTVSKRYCQSFLPRRYSLTWCRGSFNDPYSALNKIDMQYIGGRSIVFHDASSARIACASLIKV
jgi:Cu/Zn superoxide dismutase